MRNFLGCLLFLIPCLHAQDKADSYFQPYDNTQEVEKFYRDYNARVLEKAKKDVVEIGNEIKKAPNAPDHERKAKTLAQAQWRMAHPEYFSFKTPADLPPDLVWETNNDEPEIGSPEAKKGGQFNYYLEGLSYPNTIRVFGQQANNMFRAEHWDYTELSLVALHPQTGKLIPCLASQWSVSPDRRTVYFRIDPNATFSDGKAVTAEDFFMTFYIYLSDYLSETYYRQLYSTEYANITRYDDKTISITLSNVRPNPPYFATMIPLPRDFYREFGPDFEERYNWRPAPTTGAYVVGKIEKGRSITLDRVKTWWAKDKKYYRHRFNADHIRYLLVRDAGKAFTLFLKGEIDLMLLNRPKRWYDQMEISQVFDGYIHKVTFYPEYPLVPRGLYPNLVNPILKLKDVRIGIQYACNFQKIIDFIMRRDAKRIHSFTDGYGRFSTPDIPVREFDPGMAREWFAKAGFTKKGPDGVLQDTQGRRLSFSILFVKDEMTEKVMQVLKEQALLAGLEFRLDGMDGSAMFEKVQLKKHEIVYMGWGTDPPYPRYRQHFHSEEAFDEKGNPRAMTNNITSYADPTGEMDRWSEAVQDATSEEEILNNARMIEHKIYDEALWIPGFEQDFFRVGFWRWMRWPKDFNVKIIRYPYESYVYWIDEEMKADTLRAMREGRTFPEVEEAYDEYRTK